ncbi:ribonuclease H-like domain-containing protein [Candidatus Woesearchaeota archaeon]|nr:ribonuclease H-like domain-containing protein [Candidatus Woesearchaeota archaeon]
MIRQSFIFLEKIGRQGEENIWKQGIRDWQDFLQRKEVNRISALRKQYYDRKIREAQQALLENDSAYFIGKLPSVQMWRLYPQFNEECCFLDIETDSLGKITVVGLSDYYNTKIFVKGFNLEKRLIGSELQKFKLVVTFNGGAFDLPKLKKELAIELTVPHLDLKPLCVNLGLKGGLKEVERILELKRPEVVVSKLKQEIKKTL